MHKDLILREDMAVIDDMLDNCYEIKAGQNVIILALEDGPNGGNNPIDKEVVQMMCDGIRARGAVAHVLWTDAMGEHGKPEISPVIVNALRGCNVFINCAYDITWEEFRALKDYALPHGITVCRNFASTLELLRSPWARTPYNLLSEIRYQATKPFGNGGKSYCFTAPNGTRLEGIILPPKGYSLRDENRPEYANYRIKQKSYRPFPEWICPPINVGHSNGVVVFDKTLNWWADYIGIAPNFKSPVTAVVEDGIIVAIEGGDEARVIRDFIKSIEPFYGEKAHRLDVLHTGMNPAAEESIQVSSNPYVKRLLDHTSCSTVHVHICEVPNCAEFPYRVHLTGDVSGGTLKVGDEYVVENGHMLALDSPEVKESAAKYGISL